jgi:hypothetical protein
VEHPICLTCGVQYAEPRGDCPICDDERQYVGWDGQRWTTLEELRRGGRHRGRVEEEGTDVVGVGVEAATAIGQRALLVRTPAGNVLWDMLTYIDDDLVRQVRELGGISAIAISHPHFYGSMVEWAHAFDAPIWLHEADRQWVARPDPAVRFWQGETVQIGDGLTLLNPGVHFDGSQMLHWRDAHDGDGALFTGDIVHVVNDRDWVSFMYSYPNFIPERPRTIRRALRILEPFGFSRVYGGWWNRIVDTDGKAAIQRSADRYLDFALDDR